MTSWAEEKKDRMNCWMARVVLGQGKRAGRRCWFFAREIRVVLMKNVALPKTNKAVNRHPQIIVSAELLETEGKNMQGS